MFHEFIGRIKNIEKDMLLQRLAHALDGRCNLLAGLASAQRKYNLLLPRLGAELRD